MHRKTLVSEIKKRHKKILIALPIILLSAVLILGLLQILRRVFPALISPGFNLLFILTIWLIALVIVILLTPVAFYIADYLSGKVVSLFYATSGIKLSRSYTPAQVHMAKGEYEKAIEEYRKVLKEDPDDTIAQCEIADIYFRRLNEPKKALAEYYKALEQKDYDRGLWVFAVNRIADLYSQELKKPDWAVIELRRIIEKFPDTKYAKRAKERIERLR